MPCRQDIVVDGDYPAAVGPQVPISFRIFQARLWTGTVMLKRASNGIRMIKRASHQKLGSWFLGPVDVHAISNKIVDLEQHKLVDQLPMATQPRISCFAQKPSFLIREVGFRVNQPGRTAGRGVPPGLLHEAAI